jgi:hypothetical protein
MTSKKNNLIPTEILELYTKLIKSIPSLELKGSTMPYTSCNGHMFSFLDKEGHLALRLPETERDAFIKKHKTSLFEAHGTVLREYVKVPEKIFKESGSMKKYFRMSFDYVSSLKPKPTKK